MPLLSDLAIAIAGPPHPNSRVAESLRVAGPQRTAEFARIRALPQRTLTPSTHPDASEIFRVRGACARPSCQIQGLRWIQSAMLIEAARCNGGFFPVGVGHGKTIPSLLLPEALGSVCAVLLVPPALKAQLLRHDLPHYRDHFALPHVVDSDGTLHAGSSTHARLLYVVAYSEISTRAGRGILERIQPDLVIADEAHYLRHREAARTRRFLRFMRASPGTRFVCMSGTLTDSSIKDYAHLLDLSLGKNSPIPSPGHYRELNAWAEAIDVGAVGGAGALAELANEGESIRAAFKRRVLSTPGVVATINAGDYGGSLLIRTRAPVVPPAVSTALDTLAATWAWDGEEHEMGLAISRIARQISAGFFYRLAWPGEPDREWLAARNGWTRVRRQYLAHNNRAGMDSPALLEDAAQRGDWTPPEWFAWLAVRDRPAPPTVAVWISDYLVRDAAAWATTHREAIVWVLDPPVGEAIAAALGARYYGEGAQDHADLALASPAVEPVIVASIAAHGVGKNLQAWSRSLVVSPPAGGARWEQLIGRTHRQGQCADTVEVHVNLQTPCYRSAWLHAREKALYIQETMAQEQKLLAAQILEE